VARVPGRAKAALTQLDEFLLKVIEEEAAKDTERPEEFLCDVEEFLLSQGLDSEGRNTHM
jgi:hypothetical protein